MNVATSLWSVAQLLWRVDSVEELKSVLEDLLTPAEIVEVAERINIFSGLKAGKTQRELADELGLSVTTVSRGARTLKYGTGSIEKYV